MKRILAAGLCLAACAETAPPAGPDLPYVRDYRADGDQCFLVGESPDTAEFLDHTADLVACPADYEGRGVFETETGGRIVAEYPGFVLYSVRVQ